MMAPLVFDSYWSELRGDVSSTVKDWERSERSQIVSSRGKSWKVDWVRYSSLGDELIHGWIASPYDHKANGAGFLWLPGYSYGTAPPDDSNLVAGTVTFSINVHGNVVDTPYVNPAGKNDYITVGISNPNTYIYRAIVGHCLCAVDVLKQQREVSAVGVGGMSQGGGLALLVSSQNDDVKICCADMPFLADIKTALVLSHSPAYRKLNEAVHESPSLLNTVLLFDPLYHAEQIKVPVWLSAGGKDPACKPLTVETVFAEIQSVDKHYEYFPSAGHVFVPEMNAGHEKLILKYLAH
jgi:cephalosporin-C deacetylase